MSYDDYEKSRSAQEIVELYLFRFGPDPDAFLALTDAEHPITFDAGDGEVVFDPAPIERSQTKAPARLGRNALTVETPKHSPLGQKYFSFMPSGVVTLRIWSGHEPHPDAPPTWSNGMAFAATWAGRVLEVARTKGTIKLSCEPSGASMKRPGLRRNFQRACPHILYGSGCRADKGSATVSATVASVSSNRISLASGWNATSFSSRKFVGGLVEWTGEHGPEVRLILSVNEPDGLVLAGSTQGLEVSDSVSVVLGCDHTLDDCENIHENVLNFGGHPWIPRKNPVNKNNHG